MTGYNNTTRHNLNIHDPARKPTPQAAQRAERRKRFASMTPEQIIGGMSDREVGRNARRGAPMAIAEQDRRMNAEMAMHEHRSPADRIMPDPELDIGV